MLGRESIKFRFSKKDLKLFKVVQKGYFRDIEKRYSELRGHCVAEIFLPQTGTHKEWISSRANFHVNDSILRLLYLTEAFCQVTKQFNGPAAAVLVKGMVEIPLHMGYLLWVISDHDQFEQVKEKLHQLSFGKRDPKTGMTSISNVKAKEMHQKADTMMRRMFKDKPGSIDIIERLYKESNATGHFNYDARLLTGIQNGAEWKAKDRKELFCFVAHDIFQFFMYCDTALFVTGIFYKAIQHRLGQMSDYMKATDENLPTR